VEVQNFSPVTSSNEKSAQRRCKHCMLAVVRRSQIFLPCCRPLPGGVGQPIFNQLEMVTTFTYKPSLVRIMHAISSYCGNRPTNIHTHTPYKQTGPITIHCATASAQCNYKFANCKFRNNFTNSTECSNVAQGSAAYTDSVLTCFSVNSHEFYQ